MPLCSSFAIASDSVSMPEPTLTCKGLLHKLFYTPEKVVLNEKHKELMRRVFGTDNLRAIYDDDNNAAGDYAAIYL